jgi:lysophospholipase L1-like esterase
MNPLMWKLIWHFADGTSFFIGAVILLIAIILPSVLKIKHLSLIICTLVLIGTVEILLSANPLPLWFYCLWAAALAVWLIAYNQHAIAKTIRLSAQIIAALLCCAAIAIELPYHLMPCIPKGNCKVLYIVGDSVSRMTAAKQNPWPHILGEEYNVAVVNLAQSGATAASAVRQSQQVQDQNALVLIEIGGNDMFAPTPIKQFEASLEKVLATVASQKRTIIMLELPLLPLYNEYGSVQRKMASKYHAILIPKSFFVSVISAKGATVDLAHLSQEGQKLMAEKVWAIISPAMGQ